MKKDCAGWHGSFFHVYLFDVEFGGNGKIQKECTDGYCSVPNVYLYVQKNQKLLENKGISEEKGKENYVRSMFRKKCYV